MIQLKWAKISNIPLNYFKLFNAMNNSKILLQNNIYFIYRNGINVIE
jgi:hypothetical protein